MHFISLTLSRTKLTQISLMDFPILIIGLVHLSFKGCQVYLFIIVLFVIEISVSKQ